MNLSLAANNTDAILGARRRDAQGDGGLVSGDEGGRRSGVLRSNAAGPA